MQRQKFNTLGGLNIQSTWCLECDSYMHTSSIAAPRFQIGRLSILHEEGLDYS